MWKFHNFSVTQILREIKISECRVTKAAILTYVEVLNFDFYVFLHFLRLISSKLTKCRAPKMAKNSILST